MHCLSTSIRHLCYNIDALSYQTELPIKQGQTVHRTEVIDKLDKQKYILTIRTNLHTEQGQTFQRSNRSIRKNMDDRQTDSKTN